MRNLLIVLFVIAACIGGYFMVGKYMLSDLDEIGKSETATTTNEGTGEVGGVEEPGNINLSGSSWLWQYTDLHYGERVTAPEGKFVLSFQSDGRMGSQTDCNNLGGVYIQDGEVLSMGQFVSTQMYCEGSLETTYAEHLGLVNSFTLVGDTLTLNLNRDFGTMVFMRR